MRSTYPLLVAILFFAACNSTQESTLSETPATSAETAVENMAPASNTELTIQPISHATFVMSAGAEVIYNDPVGGAEVFSGMAKPTLVLVSDIHGDHLDLLTLEAVVTPGVTLLVPQAVKDKLSPKLAAQATVIANGETTSVRGISIEAIPMYNLRDEAKNFHTKGRGNGYLITIAGERIYIAGDTEDIPEMRNLKNIDRAFVPMNLPYTMPVAAAADAVIEFAPKIVYPYHYRGKDGLSDVLAFSSSVAASGKPITVEVLDWYPDME